MIGVIEGIGALKPMILALGEEEEEEEVKLREEFEVLLLLLLLVLLYLETRGLVRSMPRKGD